MLLDVFVHRVLVGYLLTGLGLPLAIFNIT